MDNKRTRSRNIKALISRTLKRFSFLIKSRDNFFKEKVALEKQITEISSVINEIQAELELLRRARILNEGIPQRIETLRNSILVKTSRFSREDITVGEQKQLREEIEKLKEILKKECAHAFVVETAGPYSGSSINDYDDQHCGSRECLVCGLYEQSASPSSNKYKTLSESSDRIVRWGGELEESEILKRNVGKAYSYYSVIPWLPMEKIIECLTDKRIKEILQSDRK